MKDLADIMLKYETHNTVNQDGENTSVIVTNNRIMNHSISRTEQKTDKVNFNITHCN